ncbi:hypothetical protein GQ55_9G615700 [Panicum hallii var. hallii]|uniref:Uncharacterized protein n=1 Tax=Panicum hallii var. hallii TaxID=1504633 RepID=A0A2T7CHP0_9POAL|nr:hypothetical protein GQ55_9G615700 [Panicum hallii var. hallii]
MQSNTSHQRISTKFTHCTRKKKLFTHYTLARCVRSTIGHRRPWRRSRPHVHPPAPLLLLPRSDRRRRGLRRRRLRHVGETGLFAVLGCGGPSNNSAPPLSKDASADLLTAIPSVAAPRVLRRPVPRRRLRLGRVLRRGYGTG